MTPRLPLPDHSDPCIDNLVPGVNCHRGTRGCPLRHINDPATMRTVSPRFPGLYPEGVAAKITPVRRGRRG